MRLNFQEFGNKSAPLLIFLHGGGVTSWMWDKQVEHFSNFHCLTIDLPGQGINKDKGPFSIKTSAQQIIEVIEALRGDKSVTLIGFSLGAQVLIQILSDAPNLINNALINSALVKPSKLGAKAIKPLVYLSFPLIKNRSFAKLQAKTLFIRAEDFERYYQETSQMKAESLNEILKENMTFTIPSNFSAAEGKILVTVGAKERLIMKKSLQEIVQANDNTTGLIIPEVGHGAPLAKPALFNKIVEEWINYGQLPEDWEILN